jgi:hypothetical protein
MLIFRVSAKNISFIDSKGCLSMKNQSLYYWLRIWLFNAPMRALETQAKKIIYE